MALAAPARRSRLLLAALVLAHLGAISHQVDGGGGLSLLQRGLLAALSPLQRGVGATVGGAEEAWRGWGFHRETYLENRRLEDRVRRLETELQARSSLAREAERLRDLLALRKAMPLETLAAQVVARDGVPWFRSLTIDKGESDGVALDDPVVSPTGVVGRVFAVGPRAARVQVLLDRDGGAGVLVERSRVPGVVSGQVSGAESGADDLVLRYVAERADVVVGDVVVTSGHDRVYPKGLVVGRVRYVGKGAGLFRDIRVEPSARFDRLEEVLVVRQAREALDTPRSVE
jgi:rod shape-determining protein MreC